MDDNISPVRPVVTESKANDSSPLINLLDNEEFSLNSPNQETQNNEREDELRKADIKGHTANKLSNAKSDNLGSLLMDSEEVDPNDILDEEEIILDEDDTNQVDLDTAINKETEQSTAQPIVLGHKNTVSGSLDFGLEEEGPDPNDLI